MNIGEMKSKRAKILVDAKAILDTVGKEVRGMTDEEGQRISDLEKQVESLTKTIETMEKMEERSAKLSQPAGPAIGAEDTSIADMPATDVAKYSLLRAVRLSMENKALDGVEGEVNAEMTRRVGKRSAGFYLPAHPTFMGTRSLTTSTSTGTIFTTPQGGFIDLLRAATVLTPAGATYLTDLKGKVAIPRLTTAATAAWVTEGNSPAASNPVADQVALTPNTLGAYVDITRQFAIQTSVDAENMVRNDLAKVMARGLETAAFTGSGSNGQPKGILNYTTVSKETAQDITPTWAEIVQIETDVLRANVNAGNFAYIGNSRTRGLLKTTLKNNVAGARYILDDDGEVNGYNYLTTNLVANTVSDSYGSGLSPLYFGAWDNLIIAMWNAVEVLVDPYTGSSSGTVRIVTLQEADIELRHPEAFAILDDIDA